MSSSTRCPGHARHWFARYGAPGTSSPTCVRCGAPNPRYRPEGDPRRDMPGSRTTEARTENR